MKSRTYQFHMLSCEIFSLVLEVVQKYELVVLFVKEGREFQVRAWRPGVGITQSKMIDCDKIFILTTISRDFEKMKTPLVFYDSIGKIPGIVIVPQEVRKKTLRAAFLSTDSYDKPNVKLIYNILLKKIISTSTSKYILTSSVRSNGIRRSRGTISVSVEELYRLKKLTLLPVAGDNIISPATARMFREEGKKKGIEMIGGRVYPRSRLDRGGRQRRHLPRTREL